ncbi:monovalent cation/H+ antiporter subunit D [Rhodopseudomonas sp. HC1]|uniref:monovalent cation/H+ antiporter subunit D n=1 Tax=Rhodopseudomonas infernalis TaxID=2897386 RepID=UPI001EE7F6F6|nr:monovalent cation/H+ antiporter subunit D [Rhodopseudomonas infernalis]MCG6204336.1 monovalent cation/H+ antiporter subunit D [Rhodopseudomonas infernalis]
MNWIDHLIILPILLPLFVGASMVLIDERYQQVKAAANLGSILIMGLVALLLMRAADTPTAEGVASIGVYRLGDWPAPFAIVLVADRLSALMLALTSILAFASVTFALARWHRGGAHFHSLFQFLLMGLNGAFLTGDLFNLFVFFELLLAASYGLVLHGSGQARVRAGLHYIAINLAASLLFLIGVSLIYAVTGTLNMADLAVRIPQVPPQDRALLEAGAAVLGVAFLVKAGMWPLCFWLPTTYAAAAAPVAAIFAIMSKVGVYILLRLSLLFFGAGSGGSALFGHDVMIAAGMATIVFGLVGALASQEISRLAGYAVLVSSGTVLAVAAAAGKSAVTASALFYLVSSTLAIAAFFMLIELLERGRDPGADMLAVTREAYGEGLPDDPDAEEVGLVIPASMAILGWCFVGCAAVIAGLPPVSGFIAKFAMLTALIGEDSASQISALHWALLALLMLSGLTMLIALTRAGIRTLWTPTERADPRVRLVEILPIVLLLLGCATMTVRAQPVMNYMQGAANSLHAPGVYTGSVLAPADTRVKTGGGS